MFADYKLSIVANPHSALTSALSAAEISVVLILWLKSGCLTIDNIWFDVTSERIPWVIIVDFDHLRKNMRFNVDTPEKGQSLHQ